MELPSCLLEVRCPVLLECHPLLCAFWAWVWTLALSLPLWWFCCFFSSVSPTRLWVTLQQQLGCFCFGFFISVSIEPSMALSPTSTCWRMNSNFVCFTIAMPSWKAGLKIIRWLLLWSPTHIFPEDKWCKGKNKCLESDQMRFKSWLSCHVIWG